MKITVLVENTSCTDHVGCIHGLSLYIETQKHRILFDAGPDGTLLFSNAKTLGIDLKQVDLAVLSHGHFDHGGAMDAFLDENDTATLYMHRLASRSHFAVEDNGYRDIGLASDFTEKYGERIVFCDDFTEIDDELMLFSDIKTADFLSGANNSLFEDTEDGHQVDRFLHEHNLLIKNEDDYVLFAGCAHRGIVNILRRAEEILGKAPAQVFSGMHLTNPGKNLDEPTDHVENIGRELSKFPGEFYTGHCTGQGPFNILKGILNDRLFYLSGGSEFTL